MGIPIFQIVIIVWMSRSTGYGQKICLDIAQGSVYKFPQFPGISIRQHPIPFVWRVSGEAESAAPQIVCVCVETHHL